MSRVFVVGGAHIPGGRSASIGDWAAVDRTTSEKYRTAFMHAVHRETRGAVVESIVSDLVPVFREAVAGPGRHHAKKGLRVPVEHAGFRSALLAWSGRWHLPARPADILAGSRLDESWVWKRLGAGLAKYAGSDCLLSTHWEDAPKLSGAERILLDPLGDAWVRVGDDDGKMFAEYPRYTLPRDLREWNPTGERRAAFLARVDGWLTETERDLRARGYQQTPSLKAESLLSASGVPHRHFTWLARHQVLRTPYDKVATNCDTSTIRRACVELARYLPLTLRPAPGRRMK